MKSAFIRYFIRVILLLVALLPSLWEGPGMGLFAQNAGISTTGVTPNASALLDLDASPGNNRGFLVPRVTFLERTDNPGNFNPLPAAAQSLLVYQTNAGGNGEGYYYNTSTTTTPTWVKLFSSTTGWSLTGNAGTSSATNFLGTTDVQDLVFRTNNTEWMRILSGGNVGIGTTSPAQQFVVKGISGSQHEIFFDQLTTEPNPNITISNKNALGRNWGLISSNEGGFEGKFRLHDYTVSATRLVVDSGGNVGIGTAVPGNNLEVVGGSVDNSLLSISDATYNRMSIGTSINMIAFPSGGSVLNLNGYNITGGSFTALQIIQSSANFPTLALQQSGGNVGIGTTVPGEKLDIGNSTIGGNIRFTAPATGQSNIDFFDGSIAGRIQYTHTTDEMDFLTAASSRLIIKSNGNVGIGTAGPSTKLDINGSARITGILLPTAGTGMEFHYAPAANPPAQIYTYNRDIPGYVTMGFGTGSGSQLYLKNDGNVGIGTTSPSSLLSIGSTSQFQVNSVGNLTKINNITYSFPAAQGGGSTTLQNDGSGNLSWGATSLSRDEADLSADVSISSANVWFHGPSVSLGPGTWYIVGNLSVIAPASSVVATVQLWNGTTTESSSQTYISANWGTAITVAGIVTLATTETWKVSAAMTTLGGIIRAAAVDGNNNVGNNASHIRAVKIGP